MSGPLLDTNGNSLETEPGPEPTPKKKRRPRVSYAEKCQAHERDKAAAQGKLGTVLTLLSSIEAAPGSERLLGAARTLIQEMLE